MKRPDKQINADHLIAGDWVEGTGPEYKVSSPYFGDEVGTYHNATKSEINSAIEKAHSAGLDWGKAPYKERARPLFNFRQNIINNVGRLSEVVAIENGKTLNEAKAGVLKGIEVLEFALSLQNLDLGGRMEVSRGVHCEYRRKPIGVVASITPFNFPCMVPMWTLPIALAMGNSFVWKPSEKTPLTSKVLGEIFLESDFPQGVLTILQGGRETVESIIDHEKVKAIAFVGSSKVAKAVYQRGTSHGKRVLALGGAKNHIVLLPDADGDVTGVGISDSFTGCGGQRCMAASVLLAVGNVDHHIDKVKERASSQVLAESMGGIITREQVDFLSKAIDEAVKGGATLVLDGRKTKVADEYKDGYWLGPTILDNVDPNSIAAKEELFGPVLSIVRCASIDEAMKIENKNPYGNACSVFTQNGALAEVVLQKANAGMLGVNIGVPVPREPFSFGGINYSKFGFGDITGHGSLDFWADKIKITTKWEMQKDHNWMS